MASTSERRAGTIGLAAGIVLLVVLTVAYYTGGYAPAGCHASTDQVTWGGVITAVLVLVGTLLAAILGGVVGHRYHNRVDRTARR